MSEGRTSGASPRARRRRRRQIRQIKCFLLAIILMVALGAYMSAGIERRQTAAGLGAPPAALAAPLEVPSGEEEPEELDRELEQAASEVLSEIITEGMTPLEQARAVFDYTHDKIRYTGKSDKSDWQAGACTGLTAREGDCFTYYAVSRALLTALGIENLPVERVGGETHHYWNLVNCGDGWYHFDACPRSSRLPSFCSFMVTDRQVADFTAEAGRCYYDFDGSLLPERAVDIITES